MQYNIANLDDAEAPLCFPNSFDAVRKERSRHGHRGVIIALKLDLLCTEALELDTLVYIEHI